MGAGKNKTHRKKRISKHVLKSQEQLAEEKKETSAPTEPVVKKKKAKKNNKIKDPSEVASYLSAWKHRDAGGGVWKFNKNMQSWLIRHMYEVSKVSKATFDVSMDYLAAGGEAIRTRVRDDATKRAMRYKDYEKSREEKPKAVEPSSENKEANPAPKDTKEEASTEEDDASRWNALSDHDKRKEYKRARKMLEVLKEK